ncbi:histidine phosphatase superfamily [Phyllosticta citribraziliensis]|uniref:Phytase A n=1 Tax=Phyllosticta citribraziliensis TaxID=989973 RepID=A0ABR1L1T2_9PEZI
MLISCAVLLLGYLKWAHADNTETFCDDTDKGFICSPEISHYWGQYSPYYSTPSEISADVPSQCTVTFAQVLSRHGARDPTSSKTKTYNETIQKIQQNAESYIGSNITFLEDLEYTLGADELTPFGQRQLYNSGYKFYQRYQALARSKKLFVRASDESRVVESGYNFTRGFHDAMLADVFSHPSQSVTNRTNDYPYPILTISEDADSNNTLSHALCTAFENESDDAITDRGQGPWTDIFLPPIADRINSQLPGANLSLKETSYIMDLCPFFTVASQPTTSSPNGGLSEFCSLFTVDEWRSYDYYQSLGKYYHYGAGDDLGPTQGVGYVNELIARLTHARYVEDHTSVNHTLDDNQSTFPTTDRNEDVLFADFSHDNDMTAIFFALGLYDRTADLNNTQIQEPTDPSVAGYSAAWTASFASRLYVEKLVCGSDASGTSDTADASDEYVRFIVNDRVIPLACADDDGKCLLSAFLETLDFAKSGGKWEQCFE